MEGKYRFDKDTMPFVSKDYVDITELKELDDNLYTIFFSKDEELVDFLIGREKKRHYYTNNHITKINDTLINTFAHLKGIFHYFCSDVSDVYFGVNESFVLVAIDTTIELIRLTKILYLCRFITFLKFDKNKYLEITEEIRAMLVFINNHLNLLNSKTKDKYTSCSKLLEDSRVFAISEMYSDDVTSLEKEIELQIRTYDECHEKIFINYIPLYVLLRNCLETLKRRIDNSLHRSYNSFEYYTDCDCMANFDCSAILEHHEWMFQQSANYKDAIDDAKIKIYDEANDKYVSKAIMNDIWNAENEKFQQTRLGKLYRDKYRDDKKFSETLWQEGCSYDELNEFFKYRTILEYIKQEMKRESSKSTSQTPEPEEAEKHSDEEIKAKNVKIIAETVNVISRQEPTEKKEEEEKRKVNVEEMRKYFNTTFNGGTKDSIDNAANLCDKLSKGSFTDKDFAKIAYMIYSSPYMNQNKPQTFRAWYQTFCSIVGCEYHESYKPNKLNPTVALREQFIFL